MDATTPDDLDAQIARTWGRAALDGPLDPDPDLRELENQALSIAIQLYLQSYLDDMEQGGKAHAIGPRP